MRRYPFTQWCMAFSEPDREPGLALLVGVLVGALTVGVVWLGSWVLLDDQSSADSVPRARAVSASEDRTGGRRDGRSGETRVRCQEVYDAQSEPLRAVAASLAQWEIHIGAMNQLVAGTITLGQAQRFWDETRIGAQRRLDRYQRAMAAYGARTSRCPAAPTADAPSTHQCARAIAARRRAMRAAATAIDAWRLHVRHMEMLRDGMMSPASATRLWLKSWHEGNQQLQAYSDASRAASKGAC